MACGLSCWPFRAGVVCSQLCSPDSLLPATYPTAAMGARLGCLCSSVSPAHCRSLESSYATQAQACPVPVWLAGRALVRGANLEFCL